MNKEIDISEMYCNSKSDSFDEFCRIARENYGEKCYSFLMSKKDSKIGVDCAASSFNNTGGYCSTRHWYAREYGFTEFKIDIKWSIHTNDKPICDLSYEQRCKLFNAWVKGEVRQIFKGGKFIDMDVDECNWHVVNVYRIKQKSEREEFIDAAVKVVLYNRVWQMSREDAEHLFDSGKFQLKEQPK